jgi:hypothetical protein
VGDTCEWLRVPVDVGYAGTAEVVGLADPITLGIESTVAAVKVACLILGTGGSDRETRTAREFAPATSRVGFGVEGTSAAVQVAVLCDTASALRKGQSQNTAQVM